MITTLMRAILTRSMKPFEFTSKNSDELEFKNLDELGLYVHIPFCRSICSFCPYCKEQYAKERADIYKKALLKEVELVCRNLDRKKEASSLYFGGGTPALMIDDLEDVLEKLRCYFEISGDIGLELHPDDITTHNLEKLKAAGVNMVSLGIQSFEEGCLEKLGRNGKGLREKLELVAEKGFDAVDVDLIFAIPGQSEESLLKDVDTAFEYGATQVSTYPFIDFTFADNRYKPMDERTKKKMLEALVSHCAGRGRERTSVWTFAKAGTRKYSSVTRDAFLGFGVSSTSLLRSSFKINTFSIDGYIERVNAGLLPTALVAELAQRQRGAYYLFWSAYAMKLDPERFEKAVGVPLEEMFGKELWIARKLGYVIKSGDVYELTDKASYLYHRMEQIYTTEYIDKMWSLLREEPFPDDMVLK